MPLEVVVDAAGAGLATRIGGNRLTVDLSLLIICSSYWVDLSLKQFRFYLKIGELSAPAPAIQRRRHAAKDHYGK